jgi:hypothetical protein
MENSPSITRRTAHQIALQEMIEAVRIAKERLEHVIEEFGPAWSLAPIVRAMQSELARQIRTVS